MHGVDDPEVGRVMARPDADPTEQRYRRVVGALSRGRGVTVGSSGSSGSMGGFGANALRVDDRIFAMLDSRRRFVVRLPRERVVELIAAGDGAPFDAGRDRVMTEWAEIPTTSDADWLSVAAEAMRFVGGAPRR